MNSITNDKMFNTYQKICKGNLLRTHKLLSVHRSKEHDYFMRDLCAGKSVSLTHPREQDLRTFNVILRYHKMYNISDKLDLIPYKF